MRFGEYLKNKRKVKNITQEELARTLGVSSVYIHQLEKAKVDAPSLERCEKIAMVLDVPADETWNIAKKERMRRFMDREGISEKDLEVLTEAERLLIKLYRSLDDDTKRDFGGMVYMLLRRAESEGLQEILEEFMKCA
ncbi:MAG: helix-turn-helix transcriptional regulator [Candidatus Dadabacteria bacterium]|nr:helix-turn-helix transcriptional regulator [Candidatus Dadabacteria bacterium]